MRFLRERHVGAKVLTALRNSPNSDVAQVPNGIDPGDAAIINSANSDDRTIVTRDNDFPNRRICTIDQGVIYIPMRLPAGPVKPEDTLDCLRRLARSGRLESLGHGVCTVRPNGISIRTGGRGESQPTNNLRLGVVTHRSRTLCLPPPPRSSRRRSAARNRALHRPRLPHQQDTHGQHHRTHDTHQGVQAYSAREFGAVVTADHGAAPH